MERGWLKEVINEAKDRYATWPEWKKQAAERDRRNAANKDNEGRMIHKMRL